MELFCDLLSNNTVWLQSENACTQRDIFHHFKTCIHVFQIAEQAC